jgi:hypothetical protein
MPLPYKVFSRRSGDWQVDAKQPLAPDREAVVFVDFAVSPPEFLVQRGVVAVAGVEPRVVGGAVRRRGTSRR